MSDCKHLHLKKQLVGETSWYACTTCPQKFKVEEWDGKVKVITAQAQEGETK